MTILPKKNNDAAWHMSPITYSETLHWLNTETHSTSPLQSISLFVLVELNDDG